ncbi:peptidase M50B-like-domain-containing protein [Kockovaella imperatae]|uniref:Peptidase M50B-like-domain-containing protein n=1 Tax=Kockovaella imperatae TaxID=4999 RepID=A0A1Y1UJC1_9TREE|nr:peptidase M50B-like-domain-containing protein [Kockovaella imperatae]ORX37215.1 peptidase M50B-like-domain-containing protein [Kockovaella imperatae]
MSPYPSHVVTGPAESSTVTLHRFVARAADSTPNQFQTNTVIVACVMFVIILIAWNVPILREIISGLKLFVTGCHELSHLVVGLLCGGQVVSICIDPNDGGATHIMGLMRTYPRVPRDPYAMPTYSQLFWSSSAVATLGAGYVGSSIFGFLFIFCAFHIVASKAAALVIHIGLLVPILRADHWIAFASIIVCEAVLIGLWFGDHGNALRFYILFVGVMSLFYVVWDYLDERLFDKRNTSDCAQFSELLGWPISGWAVFWFIYSGLVFTAAIFAGIIVFRVRPGQTRPSEKLIQISQRTDEQMYSEAAKFLPTR